MRHIHTVVDVAAPADRIWSVLTDFERYGQWNPLIRSASGKLVNGGELRLTIAADGLATRTVPVKLLSVDPGRELRWLGRLGMRGVLDGDHLFRLEALENGKSTRVVQEESFTGLLVPFVAPWLVPNMTRGFEAMNQALMKRAESPADCRNA